MFDSIDHVAFHARRHPRRLALADLASGRRWDYAALDAAIGRCAAVLRHVHGCGAGDRVVLLARNRGEHVILHVACARLGAIFAPLNWRLRPREVAIQVEDAEPILTLGDAELAVAGVAGLDIDAFMAAAETAASLAHGTIDAHRPSLLLYTSGTSGRPKGVLLSEHNIAQTAINFGLLGEVSRDSVFLVDSPMFHVLGIVANVRPALMRGAAVLVSDGFQAARTLARMADPELGVTHYFCVPQMATLLRAEPAFDPAALSRLALFTGGAPHPAAQIRAWLDDGVPVVDGSGMSETGSLFGMPTDPALIAAKAGSVGFPAPGVRARVVDGQGRDCAPGEPGDLLVKGENVFSGYWRQPEETRNAFTPDGWFITGDVAACDADGYYTLIDRKKDMFISGGENVYPGEIEAALAGHPDIAELAVVGVPDARWGEVGHMAIVPLAGVEIDLDAVQALLADRLARYKLPKRVSLLHALPRTASGKVQKAELRALLLAEFESP